MIKKIINKWDVEERVLSKLVDKIKKIPSEKWKYKSIEQVNSYESTFQGLHFLLKRTENEYSTSPVKDNMDEWASTHYYHLYYDLKVDDLQFEGSRSIQDYSGPSTEGDFKVLEDVYKFVNSKFQEYSSKLSEQHRVEMQKKENEKERIEAQKQALRNKIRTNSLLGLERRLK